ncbi:glycosyltransferase [Enterovibrio sp. ZSDZ42]|uniref:Glycosyltransferase n=1 Tax=Enterovibrio gelatinilyticus TaxID=2899819 RepID=A0ABT5R6Y2_9GAMM|nr:glycosyltransferase family 2 protein [Enterovibrio sp. ZSDZ42]MDD1796033.1 glycosyltransferase [Enterovibrio sp. ZSDZ42]
MLNDCPLVSIVMPSYNSSLTVNESIKSVLSQSYSNFELIICDDNSTDDSKSIISKIEDDRIRLVDNVFKKGACGARATCMKYANGDYIAFLDSDDLWASNKLEIQIGSMLENDLDFTYSDYAVFIDSINNIERLIFSPEKIQYGDLIRYCDIGCLTVVIRKSSFSCLEYVDSPKEDYAFWLKIIKQCKVASKVNGTLAYYRRGTTTLSSNKVKEIGKQWYVLRNVENLPFLLSVNCLISYCFNGLRKHYL